ncbi:hypothetical protein V5799_018999 [Amblyomma americanum]|uniref:Uncharacterized protein n=1 Tax=Amblyomma americanum TaxID=6943 RepID=A0AAQ4EY32_AMBAM
MAEALVRPQPWRIFTCAYGCVWKAHAHRSCFEATYGACGVGAVRHREKTARGFGERGSHFLIDDIRNHFYHNSHTSSLQHTVRALCTSVFLSVPSARICRHKKCETQNGTTSFVARARRWCWSWIMPCSASWWQPIWHLDCTTPSVSPPPVQQPPGRKSSSEVGP